MLCLPPLKKHNQRFRHFTLIVIGMPSTLGVRCTKHIKQLLKCVRQQQYSQVKGRTVHSTPEVTSPFLRSIMKHQYTVCVEGNIASGKTKLLEYFQKFSGIVEVYEEPTKKWRDIDGMNALEKMYEDPIRWGGVFQSYSQLTMAEIHSQTQGRPVKLMERSLYSGRHCFIENLHRSKMMPDLEYAVLVQWFDFLTQSKDLKVDLIVYLQTDPECLHERIRNRLRPEEQNIPLKYLQDLHNLHEDWLIKKTEATPPAPVLVLNANQDLPAMYKVYEEEKSKILFGLETS